MFATTMADAIGCAVRPHQIQEERALSVGRPVIHQGRQGSSFGLLPADVTSCVYCPQDATV